MKMWTNGLTFLPLSCLHYDMNRGTEVTSKDNQEHYKCTREVNRPSTGSATSSEDQSRSRHSLHGCPADTLSGSTSLPSKSQDPISQTGKQAKGKSAPPVSGRRCRQPSEGKLGVSAGKVQVPATEFSSLSCPSESLRELTQF